jgi:hypothetical protein
VCHKWEELRLLSLSFTYIASAPAHMLDGKSGTLPHIR